MIMKWTFLCICGWVKLLKSFSMFKGIYNSVIKDVMKTKRQSVFIFKKKMLTDNIFFTMKVE
jgi:hypothetical protein